LKEFGTARIVSREGIGNKLVFQYHVKIKVFNIQKFSRGDVVIGLHKEDNENFETIRSIEGVVFYQDENGGVQKAVLDKKSIFKENSSKYTELVKFAMPNVRNGSVLEYKYEIESPFFFNFRPWEFQWDIPKVHSEYIAVIPAVYKYNVSL